jgi:ABC-2 type transport system permease protein
MFNTWFQLCWREWKRILTDRRIVMILVGGPFFYAFIFGGVYWQGRAKHVPIVVVDQDHSRFSREITTAIAASENMQIAGWVNSPEDFLALARHEQAYACVIFPPEFERDALAGKKPRIGLILDADNILVNGSTLIGLRAIVATYQVGVNEERAEALGLPKAGALAASMPLAPATRQMFNPTSHYSFYILMGLICIAVQSVTRIGCGISIELDSVEKWKKDFPDRAVSRWEIFFSKVLATALPVGGIALMLPFVLFGAPYRGSVLFIALAFTIFALSQICIGYGYASLCRSAVVCTQLHLFMSVIVFTASGFTWPYYAAPEWIRWLGWLMPLFHMNCIVRKSALVGAPPSLLLAQHLLPLIMLGVVAFAWGWWAVRKEMSENPAGGGRD